ncbi:MAG TPA: TetR/AcrR family transcriptional regulator [Streptosporangiaceae bacterium]
MTTSDGRLSAVDDRPYHHGRLRAVLLAEAERTLREDGIEALSLRDLARQAGVSHAAPRRHFADRQALLDALAEAGFTRLADEVSAAIDTGGDYRARLRAAAAAYVRFATRDAALTELMFTAKNDAGSSGSREAAERLFTVIGDLIGQGQQAGLLPPGDPYRLQLLFGAILHGIAAFAAGGRIPPEQADTLIAGAIDLFTQGRPAAKP